jgi:lipopolysaccharide export system permease protein
MKLIDRYIIRKFLGTFFYAITLIITIAIIFDISEKIDEFIEKKAPFKAIVFDYYFNFIPFFVNLFAPLFTFIAVIFFTSRMAFNTEIVAILTGGVSFRRLLLPYMLAASVIAAMSLYLNHYVIPHANAARIKFELTYVRPRYRISAVNIHGQIKPGEYFYAEDFNNFDNIASKFSLELISDGVLKRKLLANTARYDSATAKWQLTQYFIRDIKGMKEQIKLGEKLDTVLSLTPRDFGTRSQSTEMMNRPELMAFIAREKIKGNDEVPFYELEHYRRTSLPFATFILTLIGVAISSRKVRGGIGLHIGLGLLLSFSYILFMQITNTFSTNSNLPALVAVWIPNALYMLIALVLLRRAPK